MSSSAFTPSTTTVTNNVPTNVPVVTAWESYTPTISNFGSVTNISFKYMRSGSHLIGRGSFTTGTPLGAIASFTLPTGLTSGRGGNVGMYFRNATVSSNNGGVILSTTGSNLINFSSCTIFGSTASNAMLAANANSVSDAGESVNIEFSVEIAEWAGSGTTTLATRAVEEYAYNTDTTNASNTSAFGYGPDGVNFLSTTPATAAISKRVRFQTPIQPTDSIIFEVNTNGLWRQLSAEAATTAGQQIYNYITHYNNAYGAGRILQVNSTDVDVSFAKYASTGTTYDAASGGLWGSIATGTAKWRVRKVSSGAQVGYPVSARNIVGDTSGSVVPVGMLGEKIDLTPRAVTTASAAWRANTTALITLNPGIYLVFGNAGLPSGSGQASVAAISTNSNNDSTGFINSSYSASNYQTSAAGGSAPLFAGYIAVQSGTTQQLFAKAYGDLGTPIVTITGFIVRIA